MKSRLGPLLIGLLALVAARPATAADPPRIGKLDGERVFKEYKRYQQLNQQMQDMGRKLMAEYEERERRFPLLVDEEWNKYIKLREAGTNMTPAQKQDYDKLGKLSEERDRELAELEGRANLDEKQQARWRELVAIRAQANSMLQEHRDRIQKQGAEKVRAIEAELNDTIRAAVKQVMDQRGLAMVVQSDVVIAGGEDVTEDTLKILNAQPLPAAGTGGTPAPAAGGH